jgi:hypothetical protein
MPALLHVHGRFQHAKIRDISAGAIYLEGAFGVVSGDKLVVELMSGQLLHGRSRWWIAGRCGIAFDGVLELQDALLQRLISRNTA